MGVDYLSGLNAAIENQVKRSSRFVNVLVIDSCARNFASDEDERDEAKAEVLAALKFLEGDGRCTGGLGSPNDYSGL